MLNKYRRNDKNFINILPYGGGFLSFVSYIPSKAVLLLLKKLRLWTRGVLCCVCLCIFSAKSIGTEQDMYQFNIPVQPLAKSLSELSNQTQTLVLFPYELVEKHKGNAIKGQFTLLQAIDELLSNTGLVGGLSKKKVMMISKQKSSLSFDKNNGENTMNSKKSILATVMAFLFSGSAVMTTASAQDTDTKISEEQADKDTTDSQLEVIIVTSQKRSERLQDVPVSVTAFSARDLKASNADSGIEIVRQTPNLVVSVLGNETQPKFSLRGVSTSEFNLNAVSPTGVFYDEVYISASHLWGAQTFDLERIEVLRGPQGTLFGKNTTAGAVNYISATPAYDFEGDLSVTYGSKNYRQLKGAVEAPLVDERLTARIAFDVADSDGYIENVNPEVSDRSDIDHKSGRLTVAYKNDAEDFNASLKIFHTESDAKAVGVINSGLLPGDLNAFGDNPRVFNGQALDSRQTAIDRDGGIIVRGDGATLRLEKDLGSVSLTSISSITDGSFWNEVDVDGTTNTLLHVDLGSENREYSQDLRIATNGEGPINVIAGLYYFSDEIDVVGNYNIFDGGLLLNQSYNQKRSSHAIYADGTIDFSDMYTLYGGLRYTKDKGRLNDYAVEGFISPTNLEYNDGDVTGRLGLRVKLSPDFMVFGQFARGYRSSAFNGGALTNPDDLTIAEPEQLDSYELGIKSQFFDRNVTFNASAFYYDFTDQQFTNVAGLADQQLVNAGSSKITGIEMELVAMLSDEFTFNLGLGVIDSEYRTLNLKSVDESGNEVTLDLSGNELSEAPKYTLNFGADYFLSLGDIGDLTFNASATHVASQFYTANNSTLASGDSYWDVGMRIAYIDPEGRFEVSLFGKNLTDNDESAGIVLDATSQTRFTTVPYPRRFGIQVSTSF